MNNQIYQNGSSVQPVHCNSSNDGNSSITSEMSQNKVINQTFGECEHCHKNAIKTMHMRCRHITCCFTCAQTCKGCPKCGLPSDKHLPIYISYFGLPKTTLIDNNNEADDVPIGGQTTELERTYASDREFNKNIILDGSTSNAVVVKKDQRDELYDPNATRMLGICQVCLDHNATCFILSKSEKSDEDRCGHDLCPKCVIECEKCPCCRRNIISHLEVRDWIIE